MGRMESTKQTNGTGSKKTKNQGKTGSDSDADGFDSSHVKECVGCGYCCRQAPCALANRIYDAVDKCPALIWDGKRYWCKIIQHPIIGPKHKEELAIGAGCCSPMFNQDRTNIPPPKEDSNIYQLSHEMQIVIFSFAREWISSEVIWLALDRAAKDLKDPLFLNAALKLVKEQRSSSIQEFMG